METNKQTLSKVQLEAKYLGKLVKFPVNLPSGIGTMAGTVKSVAVRSSILVLEIKSQHGGYYFREPSELIAS